MKLALEFLRRPLGVVKLRSKGGTWEASEAAPASRATPPEQGSGGFADFERILHRDGSVGDNKDQNERGDEEDPPKENLSQKVLFAIGDGVDYATTGSGVR